MSDTRKIKELREAEVERKRLDRGSHGGDVTEIKDMLLPLVAAVEKNGERMDRLEEKDIDDEVVVGRDLVRVTGATLSVQALAATVRRVLALNQVLLGVSKS